MDNIIKNGHSVPKAELTSPKTEITQFKVEKSEEVKADITKNTLNNNIIICENDKIVHNKVLKRKLTEEGIAIERVLSEGETSSGFETVSSLKSSEVGDLDDLELSSLNDCENENEDNFNVVVQIENELAYRNLSEYKKRKPRWSDYGSDYRNHKKDVYSSAHIKKRHDNNRSSWRRSSENKYKPSTRKKRSSEREIVDVLRRVNSCEHDRNTQDWSRKSRWSGNRSGRSKSTERTFRCRNSRTPERNVRCRTSNKKDRKAESRRPDSFDKYSSNPRRSSSVKKRRRSTRSPSSVWNRLDGHVSSSRVKKEKRNSPGGLSRKRERTPFLVELERKLNEADSSKNPANTVQVNETVAMPQIPTVIHQTLNPAFTLPAIPVVPGMHYLQYQQIPTVSVHNLPLVRGPTGLPVHITMTGEQIPHDMDGRPIPIGPNGYYLPVDPTGRLFPHIISPGNQAIPIHMSDDGVLRLPNSEPIPYGPCHQLPVNIDGSVIFVGPDRKPLYPHPNLPRQPPNLAVLCGVESMQAPQAVPITENQQKVHTQPQESNQKSTTVDPILSVTVETPPEENNSEAQKKHRKTDKEKETEKNIGVSPSEQGEKSQQENAFNAEISNEIILDSPEDISASEYDNGSKRGVTKSREEQDFLEIVCGNNRFTVQTDCLISDDPILKKTKQAIKSLSEKNYKPPVFGRFIMSEFSSCLIAKKFPHESPLLRNRVKLPFVTANAEDFYCVDGGVSVESARVTFKFLPQRTEEGERPSGCRYKRPREASATELPVFTFDFAMQCDLTSPVIKNLKSKVAELEAEVVRLRKVYATLFDDYRNAQIRNEKISDELGKALRELQERNSEVQALKGLLK